MWYYKVIQNWNNPDFWPWISNIYVLTLSDGSDEELHNPQPAIGSVTGEIITVQSISNYLSCVSCSGGTVQTLTSTLGKCSKCDAIIKLSMQMQPEQFSKNCYVPDQNNLNYYFTIYSDQLKLLLDDEENLGKIFGGSRKSPLDTH